MSAAQLEKRGGRPQGEIRRAMREAAAQLAAAGQPVTWRDLAAAACVGWDVAKRVHRNMVRAGELQPVDQVRTPHNNRPMVRYAPAAAGGFATAATGFGPINNVMQTWRA